MATNGAALIGHYNYWLVALSVFIAILAAYAALDLAGRITSASGQLRLLWLSGGAIAMGAGIWSMHYIGMEALVLPVPVSYDWPTVLASMLAAVAASAIALFVVSRKTMGTSAIVIGSITMGSGIAAMHYIGMEAMRLPAMCAYSPTLVAISVVLAIVISGVALFLTFQSRHDVTNWGWRKTICALVMGSAIPTMHYMGMAAASFVPMPLTDASLHHAVNISALGVAAIALIAILLLALVFIASMMDRHLSLQATIRSGEERLRQVQRYRHIVETSFDAFIGFNAYLLVEHWNAQAELTFGWTPEEAIGRTLNDFIALDRPIDETSITLRDLLLSDHSTSMQARLEVTVRHRDGHEFPAEMSVSSVQSEEKTLFAAFVHDVSERKQVESEREAAKLAAEAASQAKGEFLANMSHEIRTPLNGVIGMTELALQTELTKEQREYLETVRLSAEGLLTVINDILDFSKMEVGKVELDLIDFDLRECMESTLKTLALRADEKGLELLCDVNPEVPELLRGDPNRLRQIVMNLVGNAIKFTHTGEVALKVGTTGFSDGRHGLHFIVMDTGVGIAPEKLESVFESFNQADTSTTREYGGTGLGLTISRRLVEMMGGRIWVESELGKGSAFHVTIDLEPGQAPAAPAETMHEQQAGVLAGTSVLVVDDNRTNRRILEGLLTNWGMRPGLASDGQQALVALRAARDEGRPYRLILTDMHMPKMDGFELIERVKSGDTPTTAAIMMLTSGGHRNDAARCEELGVAAYLLKPVRQVELREAISRVLGAVSEEKRPEMITKAVLEENRSPLAALDVLLAEDNEINQKLAVRLLQKRGHRVVVVSNGRQALEAIGKTRFDLVLMDVQMPEMDGLDATSELRMAEQGTGRHQTVIAMTALVMKGDRERCLAAGMDGYLSKPIRAQELDEILEKHIVQKEQASAAADPPALVAAEPEAVDTRELLERVDNDRDLLTELTNLFREDGPRQLNKIRTALKKRDAEGVRREAHSLRGALANLSARPAAEMAAAVESAGKLEDLAAAEAALASLEPELTRVLDALSSLCQEVYP